MAPSLSNASKQHRQRSQLGPALARHPDPRPQPAQGTVFQENITAMSARNVAGNRKPKPGAAARKAGEGLEGVFACRFWNPGPIIINRDISPNAILAAWLLR
jgi:hypothetical protein